MSGPPRSAPGPDGRPTNPFEPFDRVELGQSIAARFERQVGRGPGRLAVRMGTAGLTYGVLDSAANRVAHVLLDRLGPDNEPVVLLLPQSVGQVASVLGALKAGKIYVPLEPSHPPARLVEAIADAGARLVLTDAAHGDLARQVATGPHVIEIETAAAAAPDRRPGLAVSPDAGAYIFYTSGSTGRPKGVLDTHRNVLHNVMRYTNTLHLCAEDRLTLLQGPAFSGAVSSLFGALLNGAASFPFDVAREGADGITAWLAAEAITVYHSVPALFRLVAPHGASLPALRVIRLEGDRATMRDLEQFRRHFAVDCVLVNGLGATECGLVRQFFFTPDRPLPETVVPIGAPVEDMEVVLRGEDGGPVRDGDVGEIAVRSRYLASGYWQRPDLTAERFLADPARPGSRIYRTGDVGRLRPGGLLEHLGRQDGIAKVRGQRVEVTEVETALLALPGIAEAAVTVREDVPGEPRLVAYVVPGAGGAPEARALRRALAERLPNVMVPTAFVMLERLPLNDNRKVDRRALPPPPTREPGPAGSLPPRDAIEYTLASIWKEVLDVRHLGVRDSFFDLGGDSLLAASMVEAVEQASGRRIPSAALADTPTIEGLAELLRGAERQPGPPVLALNCAGTRPPLFFLHGDFAGGGFYSRALARALGPEQPLYAIHPHGTTGAAGLGTIEAMAADHLETLRTAQPAGPYLLGGYCDGGLVALEMARRLRGEGEEVPLVMVVDSTAPTRGTRVLAGLVAIVERLGRGPIERRGDRLARWRARSEQAIERLRYYGGRLRGARRADLRGRLALIGHVAARRLRALSARPAFGARAHGGARAPIAPDLTAHYRRAFLAYLPARYPGRLVVLRSQSPGDPRPDLGWSSVSPQVQVHEVPGDHLGCITRHVDGTAARIAACLAEAWPR
jgi:amino acid adenylation domain-containing protein